MKEMKTLKLPGQDKAYEVVDAYAREQLDRYTPSMGYTEVVEILPEIMVELATEDGDEEAPYTVGMIPTDFTLESGKEYTVKYNGAEYVCVCIDAGSGMLALGNADVMAGNNPVEGSEPFAIAYAPIEYDETGEIPITWTWMVCDIDGSTSVTLSITGEQTTKIPHKFYDPGTFWVDVTESYDGVYSTSTTYGQVKAALNDGRMVGLRLIVFSDDTNMVGSVKFGTIQSSPYVLQLGGYAPGIIYFKYESTLLGMTCITDGDQEPADDAVYTI